MEVMMDMVC